MKQEFDDIKGVIRIRNSKMERHHNGQKKKDKGTNSDLQNTTQLMVGPTRDSNPQPFGF